MRDKFSQKCDKKGLIYTSGAAAGGRGKER